MCITKHTKKGAHQRSDRPGVPNSLNVYVGDITFVEPGQTDYEELYEMYNVDNRDANQNEPYFCIVHSIQYSTTCDSYGNGANMDKIDDEGDSYIIPDLYFGIIIWEVNRNIYFAQGRDPILD